MKKYIIMAIIAMAVAVQGYAQPRHHHHHHRPYYHYSPRVMPSWYVWDAIAGYYYYEALHCRWWGPSWEYPHKVQVDCIEFKRTDSGRLRIKNGNLKKQYYSMWEENSWKFTCPSGVIVNVTTGNGQTKITAYSKDGKKTSSHTLTANRYPRYYNYYGYYY